MKEFKTADPKLQDVLLQLGDLLTGGDDGVKAVIDMSL